MLAALLPNPPHTTELLQATYGEALPQFVDAKWREALSTADAQQKMLFVYLHSPDHLVRVSVKDMFIAVFLFSKINKMFLGYFDPQKYFVCRENN